MNKHQIRKLSLSLNSTLTNIRKRNVHDMNDDLIDSRNFTSRINQTNDESQNIQVFKLPCVSLNSYRVN